MNPDDIDRALREDETVTPSPEFAARVMRSVRHEAEDLGAIAFPWSRVVPGIVVCTIVLIVGIVAGRPVIDPETVENAGTGVVQVIPAETFVWMVAPLLGSWLLVRVSLRAAGYRP